MGTSGTTAQDETILVVDDDRKIVELVTLYLKKEGYRVIQAFDGTTALELARAEQPALAILDLMLPGVNGLVICRTLQSESQTPVIMLTARSTEEDRMRGLDLGADDYVVKPFSPRELLARIKAVRRRHEVASAASPAAQSAPELRYGPITIDPEKFRVLSGNREIVLTAQEFKLLELLVKHPGRVFTREQLLNRAWGDGGIVADRTIDVHVKSLRKKFGKVDFIETVRGIGYRAREL